MIVHKWFTHNGVLIMTNATVHTGKETSIVEDVQWNTIMDSFLLRILIFYFPTRSPELNPIKKIFYIFDKNIWTFRHNKSTKVTGVLSCASKVLNNMDADLIIQTI